MIDKILGMIGLCARAGKLKSGEAACEQAVKRGESRLLLVDAGASARSKKSLGDACAYAGARLYEMPEGALGHAIGKPGRMAICMVDKGFEDRIGALCAQLDNTGQDTLRGGAWSK